MTQPRGTSMSAILISDLSFEDWITFIFDNPVPDREAATWGGWWFDWDEPDLDAYRAPGTAIQYMTRLFEDAGSLLAPFDDVQIGMGLYYLISTGSSEHGLALVNATVPIEKRVRCIEAMVNLYTGVFAPRCPAQIVQTLAEPSALESTCYMWWDVLPFTGQPKDRAQAPIDRAVLAVMAQALDLPSIPCQESALHGLGHWRFAYPADVPPIIDRYLARHADLPPRLAAYARAARTGCVQ